MGCIFSVFCVYRSLISTAYRDALDIILFFIPIQFYTCAIVLKRLLDTDFIRQPRYYQSHNSKMLYVLVTQKEIILKYIMSTFSEIKTISK